jgi:hypothetical protein
LGHSKLLSTVQFWLASGESVLGNVTLFNLASLAVITEQEGSQVFFI